SRYFPSQTDLHNSDIIDTLNLLEGDFSERGKDIKSESIDLIFTDPPYSSNDLSIYHKLAILAKMILKPGGSLVTYIGQHNLPEILNTVTSNELKYWWTIAVKHTGSNIPFHQRKVQVMWKPLLWFVKGEKLSSFCPLGVTDNYFYDYIESKPPKKILHPWEQSSVEAEQVIKQLTVENQTVLDPLMGSGTTGIAALNLKRKFIGIEKDKDNFLIAKNRLDNISVNGLNNKPATDFLQNNSTS
ncbi:MAG: DNA-methyltransferase, partial [Nitrososphaeraceae archaeon]